MTETATLVRRSEWQQEHNPKWCAHCLNRADFLVERADLDGDVIGYVYICSGHNVRYL